MRHEYDLLYVDEDGVERPVETESGPRKPPAKISGGKGSKSKRLQSAAASRRKPPQPPSWQRVLKRGMIFAPIFFVTVFVLGGGKVSTPQAVVQSLLLIAVFIPFSYFMDKVVWRQHLKRLGKSG